MLCTKKVNVDFLETVNAAKLIDLVMDFIEYQGFVVVGREVADNVMYCICSQYIHNFDAVEVNHHTTTETHRDHTLIIFIMYVTAILNPQSKIMIQSLQVWYPPVIMYV